MMINRIRDLLRKQWIKRENQGSRAAGLSRVFYLIGKNRKSIVGQGNRIDAQDTFFLHTTIDIIGDENVVRIGKKSQVSNLYVRIRGCGNTIIIGESCYLRKGVIWIEDDHCIFDIGDHTTIVDAEFGITETGSKVTIGADCMFAHGIEIRCGDSHSVIDLQSGERINYAEDIAIGKHVWIASDVMVLKGVSIGDDSVIAARSLVTKSFLKNTLIGGSPAVALREGISWQRERIDKEKTRK